jgi:hypothetical protein
MDKYKIISSLIEQGYSLIELYGINEQGFCTCYKGEKCSCAGKHPVKSNWKDNFIKSDEELKNILKQHPNANFGVITGNGLVVVDIDKKSGGFESLKKIKDIIVPTFTVKTGGGGYHFYYKTSEKVANRVKVLPGIDIRGEGGYAVAPGSKHISGSYYEIMRGEENE